MNFSSITRRFAFWFVLMTLLPLVLLSYILLAEFGSAMQQSAIRHVEAIADKKVNQINRYLEAVSQDVLLRSQAGNLGSMVRGFSAELAGSGRIAPAYRQLDERYHGYFQRLLQDSGYQDVYLISPQGNVVYSHRKNADFATSLLHGPYQDTGLADVVRNALQEKKPALSRFEVYAPASHAVALFVAAPVIEQGVLQGVLAVQADTAHFHEVLLDRTGLGESGETVAARKLDAATAVVLTPLKSDPAASFRRQISLKDLQRATPMQHALQREMGGGFGVDFDGNKVVAAWRFLPAMNMGIVTKMDEAEALAPLHQLQNSSVIALAALLLTAIGVAVMLGRRVVEPLRNLTRGAQQLAAGNFAIRLPAQGRDELGQLAVAFNGLAERLQASRAGLEKMVEQRTLELKRKVEDLHIKDAAIASSISAKAFASLDGKISYVNRAFVELWHLPDESFAVGHSPLEFWEKPADAQNVMQELMAQGCWKGELHARLHDGSPAEMELIANLVRDVDGQPLCLMASFFDVTARKQAEKTAKNTRDQLAATLAAIPDLMFELDLQGTYCRIESQQDELLVAPRDDLYGRTVADVMPPEAAEIVMQALQEANEHGISHGKQINLLTPAGKLWFELSVSRMKLQQDALPHFIVLSREITQRKQMEEGLTGMSQGLKVAQRLAQVGNWELNLLTGELVWSDEIFNLFEIDTLQFGATYEAFLRAIHPDDREQVNQAYSASLRDKKPYQVVHRLQMGDGRIKWVEERCESDFAEDGTPLRSRGTMQDITRQKLVEEKLRESEARYSGVVTALAEGVMINARDGSIIAANESAQKILGLSLEQLMGRKPVDPHWRAIHEDGTAFSGDEHPGAVTLRTGKPQSDVIMGVHKPDGSLVWISINSQPIFQPGETLPSTVVASFTDITERKHAETMLRKSNEELERRVELRTSLLRRAKEEAEQANQSKSIFLTSMSHELRTPLNAILGYAQLMEMDAGLTQTMQENAREIRRAGEFLLNLMNDVLDLSRIESGGMEMKLETVPLAEVVKDCKAQNVRMAEDRNITLHMADSCAVYQVNADRRALTQVLNNLVSNAIKYNRDGGRINVSCSEEVRGRVKISVMDTGMGIAADKQPRLFQSFNRLGAEMGSIEGTGIGLVISKKLIEQMDGSIGVESVHGLGSTFWVEMPYARNAGLHAAASDGQADDGLAPHRKIPCILVVEDYVPNQKVLLLQLQTMGCQVDVAEDGAEALKMWRDKPYDLVLTDIDMPVMNGVELTKLLREDERTKAKRCPVIAITATNTESEHRRYQAAGIDEILGKPLTMDALRSCLTRWLGDFSNTAMIPAKQDAYLSGAGREALATLDLHYLYQILGQVNIDQARLLVDTFMRTAEEGLLALEPHKEDAVLVAKEMHKQKSSARTVGALKYAEMASLLEQQTKDAGFDGVAQSLSALHEALGDVRLVAAGLFEPSRSHRIEQTVPAAISSIGPETVLVVDDDLVVLQQIKAMLDALGVGEVLTAINGIEASRLLSSKNNEIEVLVCDLSMPEMDGVELIRSFGQTGFKGGLILISGADEKLISTVNKLAVLQGVRVLGQLQKPVNAAQLAILLAHTTDAPLVQSHAAGEQVVSRVAIEAAMEKSEFSVWFQPKVDAGTLRAVGMEALARWQLPDGKFVPPDNFITVAEREGMIGELSQLLVSLALKEAASIYAAGFPLKIAINLSGAWLNDLSLPDFVHSKTRAAGLHAEDVILEVTETGVMEDVTAALDVLTRLRLKGFGLSIDDFGIGYSSFEQLGRIPFTEMKLDRSFVSRGVEDPAARAILESSMDMAHKLSLSTVAEGVENERDLKLVRSLGCDLVQGYLIAKPMPVKEVLGWLAKEKNRKQKS